MNVQLPPLEGQWRRRLFRRPKQDPVDTCEERRQLTLVRRAEHQHAPASLGREPTIVQVVAIHRHERAAKLLRQLIVFLVGSSPQLLCFDHEKYVPLEVYAHIGYKPRRHIGVGVDPRARREALDVRR